MDVLKALQTRKSIRGYKPDPIPKEIIAKVLEVATRAPSALNTQPWQITVISGKVLDEIMQENIKALNVGTGSAQEIIRKPFEGIYRKRQVDLAIQIFQLMGIARDDKEKRAQWMMRGFRYFDAPAAIVLSLDKSMDSTLALCDIGILCQSICLAALEFGLGTCIEDQGILFPDILRKLAGIPEFNLPIMGLAIGYPDWDFPANKLVTPREALNNNTKWYGFE
ncbi:MAG: nitroreductase [Deltaproteobacteria bacterium]|nr:nitroreductase [Deltaproteobacteria bacterium]